MNFDVLGKKKEKVEKKKKDNSWKLFFQPTVVKSVFPPSERNIERHNYTESYYSKFWIREVHFFTSNSNEILCSQNVITLLCIDLRHWNFALCLFVFHDSYQGKYFLSGEIERKYKGC